MALVDVVRAALVRKPRQLQEPAAVAAVRQRGNERVDDDEQHRDLKEYRAGRGQDNESTFTEK